MSDTRTKPSFLSTVRAFVSLSRPINGAVAFMGVFIGAQFAVRGRGAGWTTSDGWCTVAVGFATVLILSAGNALNDACDAEIDRVNRPDRPIPSGRLTVRQATTFAAILMAIGVALAIPIGWRAVAVAVVAVLSLIGYALVLKGTPLGGNCVVAALSAMAFLAGGVAVGAARPTLVPMAFIFLFSVSREVVKDIEDVVGDARFGARTVPVAWGVPAAIGIASGFGIAGVLFSPLPYVLGWKGFGWRYLVLVLSGVDLVVLAALWGLWRGPAEPNARRAQRWLKVSSLFGLLAVYIG